MIGLVVVGYNVFPEAILIALQHMSGKQNQICAVPLAPNEESDDQRKSILEAIEQTDSGNGVLLFTDSMTSTAGHLTRSIMDKANIQVIGGVNLPMLTKVVEERANLPLEELAELARDEGRKAIIWRSP